MVSPQIAADTARLIRGSIAELEQERVTLAHLGQEVDAYRDVLTDRLLALCAMLSRLRLAARRYEVAARSDAGETGRRAA